MTKTPEQIADQIAFDMRVAVYGGRLDGLSLGEIYRRVAVAAIEADRAQRGKVAIDLNDLEAKATAARASYDQGARTHAVDWFLTDADEEFLAAATPEVVLALIARVRAAEGA